MENQEHNREALKKGVQELKQRKAPDFVWNAIEKEIASSDETNKEALQHALDELPTHRLEQDLWGHIENNISKGKTRTFFLKKEVVKIAAVVVLLIGVSFLIKMQIKYKGVIEITTAIIEESPFQTEALLENCSTNQKEIDQICSTLPAACEDPYVLELKEQLNEVNNEYNELKSMITNTSSPELLKFLHRIENEKCQIENKLLALIINS